MYCLIFCCPSSPFISDLNSLVGGLLVGRCRLLSAAAGPRSGGGRRALRHVERHLGVVGVREHLLVDPGMVTG